MRNNRILYIALLTGLLSSCSVIRGLHKDGKDGPPTFSFHQRERDTIRTAKGTFSFVALPDSKRELDTLHICEPLRGKKMQTLSERMANLSPNQTTIIIRNDTIIYEKSSGT